MHFIPAYFLPFSNIFRSLETPYTHVFMASVREHSNKPHVNQRVEKNIPLFEKGISEKDVAGNC